MALNKRWKCALWLLATGLGSLTAGSVAGQITATNISVADAFVRSMDPTNNYGGAGALSVSGAIATNLTNGQAGLLDSFMRFDVSNAVSNFNNSFGVGQWGIARATLNLFEQGAPNNPIFNRGVGPFEVRWIATHSWAEGTGNPNAPTTNGVVWADIPSLLNSNLDQSVGTFVNGGTDGVVRLTLEMPANSASRLSSTGLVSFYMTAVTNSTVGFTFHSHNFIDSAQWPFLEIVAIPVPRVTSVVIGGTDVNISFTTVNGAPTTIEHRNDLAGGSWLTLTNITGTGGIMTVGDSGGGLLPKRFYRVGSGAP